ncbi:MAG: hypothetical protein GY940_18740 [bacterium]|nr:hypothetical protein [bacterium]
MKCKYILIVLTVILFVEPSLAAEIHGDVPVKVERGQKYLFYLHGAWPEHYGLTRAHPKHGMYRYDRVAETFSKKGFILIFKPRLKPVKVEEYAVKVAGQVRGLMKLGVRAENIYIMGHSKGASITLMAAGLLDLEKLNVIVMAGCGKSGTAWGERFNESVKKTAGTLKGRFLSLYDAADQLAGTCNEAFSLVPGLKSKETVFKTGKGHGLFFEPRDVWVDAVTEWAGIK